MLIVSGLAVLVFQFTLPCRERQVINHLLKGLPKFQFTLPCRERPCQVAGFGKTVSFNSRSRVGSDPRLHRQADRPAGFNSRSRVGSDGRERLVGALGEFQFTLPCRERPSAVNAAQLAYSRFNSRSRVGSDDNTERRQITLWSFNSRSRVGSDSLRG